MTTKEEWIEKDLKYVWHPDTQMKQYEGADFKPVLIEKGKGIYLYDSDGNSYIDGVSSWWVNTLGHSVDRLNKTLLKQAESIEHIYGDNRNKPIQRHAADDADDSHEEPLKRHIRCRKGGWSE